MTELVKRKFVYICNPDMYEIPGCKCGHTKYTWSEYVDLLWCFGCEKEFTPEHWGMFDGPCSPVVLEMFGIPVHRYEIETGKIIKFEHDDKGNISQAWLEARP